MAFGYVKGKEERRCTECGMVRTRVGGKCNLSNDYAFRSITCAETGESAVVEWVRIHCQGKLLVLDNPYWNHNEPDYARRSKRIEDAKKKRAAYNERLKKQREESKLALKLNEEE